MQPGILKFSIDIEKMLVDTNTMGEPTETWVPFLRGIHAAIEPLLGRQFYAAQQMNSEITHQIRMRFRHGITSDMRVKYGNRYFRIIQPPKNVKEAFVETVLMCGEVFPNG